MIEEREMRWSQIDSQSEEGKLPRQDLLQCSQEISSKTLTSRFPQQEYFAGFLWGLLSLLDGAGARVRVCGLRSLLDHVRVCVCCGISSLPCLCVCAVGSRLACEYVCLSLLLLVFWGWVEPKGTLNASALIGCCLGQ